VPKNYFFVHEKEMIIKIPVFSQMKKLVSFIRSKMEPEEVWTSDLVEDFIFLPSYLNLSFCFYMPDNSMAPMILENDRVSIFKTHTINPKVPCLFLAHETLYLRYVQSDDQQTHLYPVNRQYDEITFNNRSNDWQVVGIALSLWRENEHAKG
jgi:SOS-response transcriptional repressor LexA